MSQTDWPAVLHEFGLGHPLKFIWRERSQSRTTCPNFRKQFYRGFPGHTQATVRARNPRRASVSTSTTSAIRLSASTCGPGRSIGLGCSSRRSDAAVRLSGRRHEEPQLARQPPADAQVLRRWDCPASS